MNNITKIVIKSLYVMLFILLLTTTSAAATTVSIANVTAEPGDTVTLPILYIVQNGTYTAALNGDVNGDGVVDIADAIYLAKHVLGKSGFEELR